jgi:hypothetical protein
MCTFVVRLETNTNCKLLSHNPVLAFVSHQVASCMKLCCVDHICSLCLLLCAGQWRYASNKLKTIWSKQHGGSHHTPALKPAAAPAEQQETEQASTAAAVAPAGTEPDQAATDALGRAVLLRSAEELSDAFWTDSKKGKGLLQEVRVSVALAYTMMH